MNINTCLHRFARRVLVTISALPLIAIAAQPQADKRMPEPAVIGWHNTSGIQIERVSYPARNLGTQIIANVFRPAGFDPARQYPAIIITHPFGGVKEQTAGLYAARLAEQGFVTLAFDKSWQGESGGEPRLLESPGQHVDDISSGIDYLIQLPGVDSARIGSLGICAGGSYALANAPTELRVKAVATVSYFDLGDARRRAMGALSDEARLARLQEVAEQRSREARGEPVRLVPVVPDSEAEFTAQTPESYRQGYDYYRTARARHPNSPNRYVFTSLAAQMAFFPSQNIEALSPRPLLMIVGERADTRFWSEEVIGKVSAPKELFVIPDAAHLDLYDRPQFVAPAVDKLARFYRDALSEEL